MLLLTRKRNESIKIGNDIVIKVIQTKNGTVKLGIDAPAHIRVLRSELTEFEQAPVVATATTGRDDETETLSDPDSDAEDDCYVEFNAEFLMEVEDQMLCVASD